MSSFPPREHSHRLTESAHYCIDHEFEDARLRRIDGTDVKIGDFYGEPNAAIIDKDERWCAVGGCGLIVYRLREPFEAYDDDRQSVQWEEFYRSPPEIWWIGSMEQIDAESFGFTFEKGDALYTGLCRVGPDTVQVTALGDGGPILPIVQM